MTGATATSLAVRWLAPANAGRPPISDYDLQYRQEGTTDWTPHDHTGTGRTATLGGLEPNTAYEVQVRAHNDEGTSPWSLSGTGRTKAQEGGRKVTVTNQPPQFGEPSATRSVAENRLAGSAVGAPVVATDPDNDPLTYSLSGSSAFVIDAGSGQITVAAGATLNYETTPSYEVKVAVDDGRGGQGSIPVTIDVTDVDEPPDAPDAPTVTAAALTRLTVAWTAPANAGRPSISDYDLQYRVEGSNAAFADAGYDGTGTTATLSNLTPNTAYEVQVRAHNHEGTSPWSLSGTGRTNANTDPTFAETPGEDGRLLRSVAENTPAGKPIGAPVTATDADGDALTYTLTGPDAASFALDETSGQIQTRAALDYEAKTSYTVTVAVSDAHGGSARLPVTILVTDVDEPPDAPGAPTVSGASTTSVTVAWTAPANAGRPPIRDYDLQYRIEGSDAAFADANYNGTGTTATLSGLIPATAYEVQVRAHNHEGTSPWSLSGTGRTNANTNPTFAETPGEDGRLLRSVAENTPAGKPIGAPVTATDADGDALTYTLTGPDASSFALDETSGQIQTHTALNYETRASYSVTVTASDAHGGSARLPVRILVTDVAEPPDAPDAPDAPTVTGVASTSLTVVWLAPTNAGRPPISDYDLQYRVAGSNAAFADAGYDGPATTATLSGLIPATAYEVQVRARNHEGTSAWSLSGTGRTNANTNPTFAETPDSKGSDGEGFGEDDRVQRRVAENTSAGVNIGAPVTATDADGDALTYALIGPDASSFALDETSGQIQTHTALDYETRASYSVTVTASDAHGGSAHLPVRILVTDVDEPPDAPDAPTITGVASTSLTVVWQAPANAGRPPISDYDLQYRVAGRGSFTDAGYDGTGTTATLSGLTPNTAYQVQVRARNHEGTSPWSRSGTGRTSANTKPTFAETPDEAGLLLRRVAENTPGGQPIGTPVTATDADGDALTYALIGPDASSFVLDETSGQIQTYTALNYETRTTYTVAVAVRDAHGGSAILPVRILVTDVAEPPNAPDAPTVTGVASTSLTVVWQAPVNAGRPPISDYDLQYRVAGRGSFTDAAYDGTGTTATLSGLTPATAYEVQVRARNHEGTSPWSRSGTGRTSANTNPTFAETPDSKGSDGEGFGEDDRVQRRVAENTPAGQPIGVPVTATDADGDALTYTLTGPDASSFALDETSGQIQTHTALDYEAKATYTVTIAVSDAHGGSARLPVVILVTDVAEPPDAPDAPTITGVASTSLTVVWQAPANAGRPPISDYDLQYRVAGRGSFIDAGYDGTGTTATLSSLTPATAYEVQVRARNHEGTSPWSRSGTGRTNANTNPTFAETPDSKESDGEGFGEDDRVQRHVAENAPAGQPIGAPVTATDADGDALTYALIGARRFVVCPRRDQRPDTDPRPPRLRGEGHLHRHHRGQRRPRR